MIVSCVWHTEILYLTTMWPCDLELFVTSTVLLYNSFDGYQWHWMNLFWAYGAELSESLSLQAIIDLWKKMKARQDCAS